MYLLFMQTLLCLIILFVFFFLMLLMSPIVKGRELMTNFECGFDSKMTGRLSFSIRFLVFLILFIFFDFELTLILPIPNLLSTTMVLLITLMWIILFSFILEEKFLKWI